MFWAEYISLEYWDILTDIEYISNEKFYLYYNANYHIPPH